MSNNLFFTNDYLTKLWAISYKRNCILWHFEVFPTKEIAFYDILRYSLRRKLHFMAFWGIPYEGNCILWHFEVFPTKGIAFYGILRYSIQRELHFMTFWAIPYEGNYILWHFEVFPTKGISIYKFCNAKKTTHLGYYYLNGLFFILDSYKRLFYKIQLSINKVFFLAI